MEAPILDQSEPPPAPPRKRLNRVDYLLFGIPATLFLYAAYRVNDVLVYDWNWSRVFGFVVRFDEETGSWVSNLLLQGLASTLRLAFWALILAGIIGVIVGYWRTCQNLTLRIISRSYVELIRNIPPLVFLFIFYFFVSTQIFQAVGLDEINTDSAYFQSLFFSIPFGNPELFQNFLAGVLSLALFVAAYVAEIVRAGIQSIDQGQWEAARATGLSRTNVLRDVILPQALKNILPPLAGQFIVLIKYSSLASLVSVQELTFLGTEVAASTTRVFETWILVAVMYFALSFSLALCFKHWEKRANKARR